MAKPRVPAGIGTAGKSLWRQILGDLDPAWELDARERHLLMRASRCADELARLERVVDKDGVTIEGSRGQRVVHPAQVEARQLRLVQMRLLGELEMCDPATAKKSGTPAVARARRAADARWNHRRDIV